MISKSKSKAYKSIVTVCIFLSVSYLLSSCEVDSSLNKTILTEEEETFVNRLDSIVQVVRDSVGLFDGLAITIVKDNKVLMAKGYGVLNRETQEPVTDESMFYVASTTKSFVGLMAAILDQKGIFSLNTTLQEAFPDVKFNDSIPGDKVTMSHLLSHTSTVNNGPLTYRLAHTGQISDSIQSSLVEYSVPNGKQLGEYLYDNTGYNLYTIALREKTGLNWKDALKEYVLDPLNMKNTTAYMSDIEKFNLKYALPSASLVTEKIDSVIPMRNNKRDATMHSAGGLTTNAQDVSKWLLAQLDNGKINGVEKIDSLALALSHQNFANVKSNSHYTLGWNKLVLADSSELFYHGGNYTGYNAVTFLFPKHKLGIALMSTGLYSDYTLSGIQNFVLDYYRNPDKVDDNFNANKKRTLANKVIVNQAYVKDINNRRDRQWTIDFKNDHGGNYYHESYGNIQIRQVNKEIKVIYGNLEAIAEPYTLENSIRVELIPYEGEAFVFKLDESGNVEGLTFRGRFYRKL
jgi:CubicO group peptidase (beta-lactamase class C family)